MHSHIIASFPGPAQLSVVCSTEKDIFNHMQREPGNEAISFIHLILQFVFYSLKKPMISDRKKKLETAPIKSDSVYNTQKREKNGDVFPYK